MRTQLLKKIAPRVANCVKGMSVWVAGEEVIHISKSPNMEAAAADFGCEGRREEMEEKRAESDSHCSFSEMVDMLPVRYSKPAPTSRVNRKIIKSLR